MRFSTSPLLSAVMLCAASQSAVGAMALMDLDSRQILQLEGSQLFITEPLAEQLNSFPGMADKPVKEGSLWQRVRDTIILTTTDINEAEKSR